MRSNWAASIPRGSSGSAAVLATQHSALHHGRAAARGWVPSAPGAGRASGVGLVAVLAAAAAPRPTVALEGAGDVGGSGCVGGFDGVVVVVVRDTASGARSSKLQSGREVVVNL